MAWLISQAMMNRYSNSHCLREQAAEFSVENCSDGEPSVLSKSTPMPQACLLHGKTTGAWNRFPSGMTFEHSEATTQIAQECLRCFEESGVDSSSAADSRVKTSQLQEQAQDSTENDQDCGQSKRESFAKYDPLTHSWRTRQRSLEGGFIEFSQTWPRWGSMRNGELFHVLTLVEFTSENESGLRLPTPRSCTAMGARITENTLSARFPNLETVLARLCVPTIGKNEFKGSSKKRFIGSPDFRGAKMSEGLRICESDPIYLNPSFAELVMMWPMEWTDLRPLGMDKFREWLRQHGNV